MQAAGQPHQPADHRAAEQAAHHGADGAGVGDGVFDMQTEIGPHNAENGEGDVAQQLVRQANGDLHQGDKQSGFAHQPRDDQKYAHLLKQQQHQIKLVHTRKPHIPESAYLTLPGGNFL